MGYREYVADSYKNSIHKAARNDISNEFAKKLIVEAKTYATEYVHASLEKDLCVTTEESNEASNFLLFDELVNYLNDKIEIDVEKLTRILELDYELYCFGLSYVNGHSSYRDSMPRMAGDKYRAILSVLSSLYICHNRKELSES
jgi:hypothetical protein